MAEFVEKIMARIWNGIVTRKSRHPNNRYESKLDFGLVIKDGQLTNHRFGLNQGRRSEHLAILGKTGSGKSYLLRHLASQDVSSDHGFVYFDLHGDATPYLLKVLASREKEQRIDLSEKVIVIDPSDTSYSVGLNVLEAQDNRQAFVQIAEFAEILKTRWHLDSFGARTEELLRNALYVIRDNHLTLLELSPYLLMRHLEPHASSTWKTQR